MRRKYIHTTKENRLFVAKAFKVSERMVMMALSFDRNGENAEKMRRLALQRGGILMNELPMMETFHDADGYMRQYLANGALLEFNKKDNSGDVFFKGKNVKHLDKVMVSDIEGIQNWALSLR